MQYTIVLGPQDTGGFTARCVEIPGAVTLGVNKGEALANIKEAIELHVNTLAEDGLPLNGNKSARETLVSVAL